MLSRNVLSRGFQRIARSGPLYLRFAPQNFFAASSSFSAFPTLEEWQDSSFSFVLYWLDFFREKHILFSVRYFCVQLLPMSGQESQLLPQQSNSSQQAPATKSNQKAAVTRTVTMRLPPETPRKGPRKGSKSKKMVRP